MDVFHGSNERASCLEAYTSPVKPMTRELVGREHEMMQMRAGLARPEYSNIALLGEAGSGKTAIVQGLAKTDPEKLYLEVDLAKMISDLSDANEMAARLKELFDEVERLHREENKVIVLFMDEFHQVVQLSAAAVEALKPLLADSGTRGIRVIAATTLKEFNQYIMPNQPLVERLQRITLSEPGKSVTMEILKSFAKQYGVEDKIYGDGVYEAIYEQTNRYIPANAQPRKSILLLDAMIGYHNVTGRPLDKKLLADVIYQSEGINVNFRVDATKIREELDRAVFAQRLATSVISDALQIAVADLNDSSRPMCSLLLSGPSGCGKTEVSKQLAAVLFGVDRSDGDANQSGNRNLIRLDMTEYSQPDSVNQFRVELTSRVWERPFSVILLDEIEKACGDVTRLLLQVLDDGRLTDAHGRQVVFTNAYIIMTTNAASEIYRDLAAYGISEDNEDSIKSLMKFMPLIRRSISNTTGQNKFPPELLGRFDAIVPFQPLSDETKEKIAKRKLKNLAKEVQRKHGVRITYSKDVVSYLVYDKVESDANAGGARQVVAKIREEVVTPVSAFLNANPRERDIGVKVVGDMAHSNKFLLESNAHIVVGPYGDNNRLQK